jgi:hypothetical protein
MRNQKEEEEVEEEKPEEKQEDKLSFLKKAFSSKYHDPHDLLTAFEDHITKHWTKYKKYQKQYLSPYIALFQSSGYGKSRLIQQLTQKGYWIFYLSFARPQSTAFPRRSLIAEPISQLQNQEKYAQFFTFCINYLEKKRKENPKLTSEEWFALLSDPRSGEWDLIWSKFKLIKNWNNERTHAGDLQYIFAFDEARELLTAQSENGKSSFRNIRAALRSVFEKDQR